MTNTNKYTKYIEFFVLVGKLKRIKRKGWVLRNISNSESVADHIFRTTIMALVLSEKRKIDTVKVLKMALIHDLAEIEAGDQTPYDEAEESGKRQLSEALKKWTGDKNHSEKLEKERVALKQVVKLLSDNQGKEIRKIWEEFAENRSSESRFVQQIDKIEMLFQALEYKKKGNEFVIKPFWEDVKEKIIDSELRKIFNKLKIYFK